MNPFKAGAETALDPNKMQLDDMLRYRGAEYRHFDRLRQNLRLARPFLLGTSLACLAAAGLAHYAVKLHVFGADGKGGDLLRVTSRGSLDDQLYGRNFQTMMYLAEPTVVAPESLETARKGLAEFGLAADAGPPQPVRKRAPHPKYL